MTLLMTGYSDLQSRTLSHSAMKILWVKSVKTWQVRYNGKVNLQPKCCRKTFNRRKLENCCTLQFFWLWTTQCDKTLVRLFENIHKYSTTSKISTTWELWVTQYIVWYLADFYIFWNVYVLTLPLKIWVFIAQLCKCFNLPYVIDVF